MENGNFFMYKNKPLVRKGSVIYYGYIYECVVAMLTVESSHIFKDINVSDKIVLQLISTDEKTDPKDLVLKYTVKNGLFEALDIAGIWIDRYIKKLNV